jgi:hypothetical protein
MADDRFPEEHGSLIARLFHDPVRLRRWSRWAALLLVIVAALASDGLGGAIPGLVFPLAWLCLPFVALGIGFGDAFFIRHGIGIRLEALMLIGGVLVAIGTCVLISTAGGGGAGGTLGRLVDAVLYGLLYGGLLSLLAALVGFGFGRGLDYAGRRIESLSDEDW